MSLYIPNKRQGSFSSKETRNITKIGNKIVPKSVIKFYYYLKDKKII